MLSPARIGVLSAVYFLNNELFKKKKCFSLKLPALEFAAEL